MIQAMASLSFFVQKFGRREGRKQYNLYHAEYRRKHRKKITAYNRTYGRLRKAREISAIGA
jgi:hypothetical protein